MLVKHLTINTIAQGRSMSTIVCIGGGSMASLFTAQLAINNNQLNNTIYMLTGQRPHTESVKQHGLYYQSLNHTPIQHCNVLIANTVHDITKHHNDIGLIMLYIKAVGGAVDHAAQQCLQLIQHNNQFNQPPPVVLTMMNGVGHHDTLCNKLQHVVPASNILVGSTSSAAIIDSPGRVVQTGHNPVTIIANDTYNIQPAEYVCTLLQQSGFNASMQPLSRKDSILWTKLLYNCTINTLGTILQVKNGELKHDVHRYLFTQITNEFIDVCNAANITLDLNCQPNETIQQAALRNIYIILSCVGNNINSTLADILSARPTENELLLGTVVRTARQYNVCVPYIDCCYSLINAKQLHYTTVLH